MDSPSSDKSSNAASKDTVYDTYEDTSSLTPDSGVHDLSQLDVAQRAKIEEQWKNELAEAEREIATLRQILSSKIRRMQELKRKLGISVWKEFRDDIDQGLRNIQESPMFQKTSQTIKTAGEKTSEALGTIGASVTKKFEEVKNLPAFKNIEEKVGTAYTNVKTKVAPGEAGLLSGEAPPPPPSSAATGASAPSAP